MSKRNFKDTFTKAESNDDLVYDDTAFSFFAVAILSIVLIPYFFYLLRQFRKLKKVNK